MELPEDIDQIASDIVRADYSSSDEPDFALYLAIGRAINAERKKNAAIALQGFTSKTANEAEDGAMAEKVNIYCAIMGVENEPLYGGNIDRDELEKWDAVAASIAAA